MTSNLPPKIVDALSPLFEQLPPDRAMARLVVPSATGDSALIAAVESVLQAPVIARSAPLAAAIWLYVDELDRSYRISQGIDTPTGSFWHGIMHRREGDFNNSHYWFRRAGEHPAYREIGPDYDPHRMIDDVERAWRVPGDAAAESLVERQRQEWLGLFTWCAIHEG